MTAPIPAIVVWGGRQARDYGAAEIDATLWRSFHDKPAGFLVLDSCPQGQRFKAACACWGLAEGYLYVSQVCDDGQGEVCALRLTPAGRERYCSDELEAAP